MSSVTAAALSGLNAQALRLEAGASNTANARTRGALPEPDGSLAEGRTGVYRAQTVTQSTLGPATGGTRATLAPLSPAFLPEYAPDETYANEAGLVAAPNVDPAREAVVRSEAARSYEANLAILRTEDDLLRETLNLKA